MLYHLPDNVKNEREALIENKKKYRTLYNPVHNIPNDSAYKNTNKPNEETGSNIDITSKD